MAPNKWHAVFFFSRTALAVHLGDLVVYQINFSKMVVISTIVNASTKAKRLVHLKYNNTVSVTVVTVSVTAKN